jgi:parallel beta-helix repeat protein
MGKVLVLFLTAILLGLYTVTPSLLDAKAQAVEVWVPDDYPTIQGAINGVENGSIIHIRSGVYTENVRLNKSVNLIGENADTTIIDGNYAANVIDISNIVGIGLEIQNLTVRNAGPNVLTGMSGFRVANSINIGIYGCTARNCTDGIQEMSGDVDVGYNTITNNTYGIVISSGGTSRIYANMVSYNGAGILITSATSHNTVYRNSFVQNVNSQANSGGFTTWDNGAEGNYWSDYLGQDLDGDGIGDTDTPHLGLDYHPLMEPWSLNRTFNVTVGAGTYMLATFSNTTIASFAFNETLKQISFNSTAPNMAIGFCNVTVPKNSMWGNFNVSTQNQQPSLIISENGTHNFLSFTFNLSSTQMIKIDSTYAVPELPLVAQILILLLAALSALGFKRFRK